PERLQPHDRSRRRSRSGRGCPAHRRRSEIRAPTSRAPGMIDDIPVAFDDATVADAMSRGVISVPPETPLRVVARMMATFRVHAIFVFEHTDEDDEALRLWAVVSDLDLVAATQLDLDRQT